jgi:hypothetical protein
MAPHERDHAHHCQTQQHEKNNFTHDGFMIHLHTFLVKAHFGSSKLVLGGAGFAVQLNPVPPTAFGMIHGLIRARHECLDSVDFRR